MTDSILYYPAISLPKNEWSIKSILYWNDVGVIVPSEYVEKPSLYGSQMLQMIRSNLVKQIISDEYMGRQYQVSDSVIAAIENEKFDLRARQINFGNRNVWRIHKQKFSEKLFRLLLRLKIAEQFPGNRYNWYLVEEKTASIMMTYLAGTISKDIGYTPVTDEEEYIKENDYSSIVENDMNLIRSQILEEVMPFPSYMEFSDLLNFKEKYTEQLFDLRRLIESTILTALAMPNEESKNKFLQIEIQKINDGRNELVGRMQESSIKNIFLGTFQAMILDGAISVLTGDVISPATTLLGGVNEVIKEYKGNPIKDEDLAYLALIDQKLKNHKSDDWLRSRSQWRLRG